MRRCCRMRMSFLRGCYRPMANPVTIDKRTARTQFSRAAAAYDDVAVLQHEIAERLIQRLDYIV